MKTTRRTFLGGMAAASVPVAAVAEEPKFDLQNWLDTADPQVVADYHAGQLCKAMDKVSPWKKFRFNINTDLGFAFVVGDEKPERQA